LKEKNDQTMMESLVQLELNIPDGVPESEVENRQRAEAAATETLADEGHLVRLWRVSADTGPTTVLGLYQALAAFLASARETAAREEGTVTWYAFKLSDTTWRHIRHAARVFAGRIASTGFKPVDVKFRYPCS
jgi:muconolactone delta-isomerase